MLDLTVPVSSTYTSSEHNTNYTAIENKFGAIDNSDISASAAIAVTKLAAYKHEVWISLAAFAAWPGGNVLVDWWPLPGSDGDSAWTLTDISWVCTDTGDNAGTFSIVLGAYDAIGTWTTDATYGPFAITGGAADQEFQARALQDYGGTIQQSSTKRVLGLLSVNAGVGVLSAAGSKLMVSICLKRSIIS